MWRVVSVAYGERIDATPDDFRALARSSPWRWKTLQFTLTRRPAQERLSQGVRAWLRRPDLVRVETLDGELVQVIRQAPDRGVLLTSTGQPSAMSPPAPGLQAALDEDGLCRDPRDGGSRMAHDAPMFSDYNWVAMLDPVELSDGDDGPGTLVGEVSFVDHHGRTAMQAVLTPTNAYAPRCSCCALLYSEISDLHLAAEGVDLDRSDDFAYPEAHRVRLDVQTGVCIDVAEIGGSRPGRGHEVRIEAVDDDMADIRFPTSSW